MADEIEILRRALKDKPEATRVELNRSTVEDLLNTMDNLVAAITEACKAFGAPCDYGYNTPKGNALFALHRARVGRAVWPIRLAERAAELEAELEADNIRLTKPRIIPLPIPMLGYGVCVGGRYDGWLVRQNPDGKWVTQLKPDSIDPFAAVPEWMRDAAKKGGA